MTMRPYDNIMVIGSVIFLAFIFYFTSFSSLVYNDYFYTSLFEQTNVDVQKSNVLTKDLLIYFRNSDYSIPAIETLTPDENSHIKDVKIIINNVLRAFYLIIIFFALVLFFAKNKQKVFFYGGILGIILPFILLFLNFSFVFTVFHQILFPQGNWIFPENSALVSAYTFDFFRLFALSIFLSGEFISVLCVISATVSKYAKNHLKQGGME